MRMRSRFCSRPWRLRHAARFCCFAVFSIVSFLGHPAPCKAERALIVSYVGNGVKGFAGDGGPAGQARLNGPTGIVRGPDSALYICDTGNHRIRKVTALGRIVTIVGTGEAGWSGDGGPATAAKLNEPYEVRLDKAGNIFWVERLSHSVRKLEAKTGKVSTIAGT